VLDIGRFKPQSFDTILMMGNNFGLFGSERRARRLLKDMNRITSSEGRIVAETVDPYVTDDPLNISYHGLNRRRGRMGGQVRLRIRHKNIVGPWFDYLLVSQRELTTILRG